MSFGCRAFISPRYGTRKKSLTDWRCLVQWWAAGCLEVQGFLWPWRGKLGTAWPTHSRSSGAFLGSALPSSMCSGLAQDSSFSVSWMGWGEKKMILAGSERSPFHPDVFGLWCRTQGSALVFLQLILWGQIIGRKWEPLHVCWYSCFLFGTNVHWMSEAS